MKPRAALLALIASLIAIAPAPAQQPLKVLCTQALRTSLLELVPRFEQRSGARIELAIAPSGRLVARVRDGERADLVIANAPNIDGLIKDGKISGVRIDLARAE